MPIHTNATVIWLRDTRAHVLRSLSSWFCYLRTMMKHSLKVDVAWLAWAAGGEGEDACPKADSPHPLAVREQLLS